MSIFTLEVEGHPVACIRAGSRHEAEDAVADPWFRDGLLGLERDGHAVWNGRGRMRIRQATWSEEERMMARERQGRSAAEFGRGVVLLDDEPASWADSPAEHQFILASRVEHTQVFNDAGRQIGHVVDLSIDRRTGQVVYAIVSFGGFLGIGRKFHPVPWHLLEYHPQLAGYVVPLDREALEQAPHYGADELRQLGGKEAGGGLHRVFEYYGKYGPPPF